jgi:hypothetical protein
MTTEWAVVPLSEQVTLNAENAGEVKVAVTNPGEVADTAVFEVIPGEGAQRSWIVDVRPERQKLINGGETVEFIVRLQVPDDIASGRSDMKALVYSANFPPEEGARFSSRITFAWEQKQKPTRKIWPLIAGAVAMVVAVAGVGTWLALSGGESKPEPTASPSASSASPVDILLEAESLVATAKVSKKSTVVVQANCCGVTWSGNSQLFFGATAIDETLSLTITVPRDGTFTLRTVRTTSPAYADTVWTVDGQLVGATFAGYTQKLAVTPMLTVGSMKLAAGEHTLTLRIVGKQAASLAYWAGLDKIQITSRRDLILPDIVNILPTIAK